MFHVQIQYNWRIIIIQLQFKLEYSFRKSPWNCFLFVQFNSVQFNYIMLRERITLRKNHKFDEMISLDIDHCNVNHMAIEILYLKSTITKYEWVHESFITSLANTYSRIWCLLIKLSMITIETFLFIQLKFTWNSLMRWAFVCQNVNC